MPKNPSELARLEEELKDAIKEFKNLLYPKSYREAVYRDLHKLELALDIPEHKWVKP